MYQQDQAMQITVPATPFEMFLEQGGAIHNKGWKIMSVFPFSSFYFSFINSYLLWISSGWWIHFGVLWVWEHILPPFRLRNSTTNMSIDWVPVLHSAIWEIWPHKGQMDVWGQEGGGSIEAHTLHRAWAVLALLSIYYSVHWWQQCGYFLEIQEYTWTQSDSNYHWSVLQKYP